MEAAGFKYASYRNYTGGIVAMHYGFKIWFLSIKLENIFINMGCLICQESKGEEIEQFNMDLAIIFRYVNEKRFYGILWLISMVRVPNVFAVDIETSDDTDLGRETVVSIWGSLAVELEVDSSVLQFAGALP